MPVQTTNQLAAAENPTPSTIQTANDGAVYKSSSGGIYYVSGGNLYMAALGNIGGLTGNYGADVGAQNQAGIDYLSKLGIDYNNIPTASDAQLADWNRMTGTGALSPISLNSTTGSITDPSKLSLFSSKTPLQPTTTAINTTPNPIANPGQIAASQTATQQQLGTTAQQPAAQPINYQLQPGETPDQYNQRIAAANPNLPAPGTTSPTGIVNNAAPASAYPTPPLPTGTHTGAAGNIDTNYQLQPGETIDAYNARIATYNASKPVTQPSGPVGQSGTLGSQTQQTGQTGQPQVNDPYAGLDPIQKQVKMYTDAYNALGLSTIKQQFEEYTKQLSDIQNELNDKKQANQNNPWLSQGLVDRENAKLDTKYAIKIDTFTRLLSLTDSLYKQGQAQVDHLVSDANADIKATNDLAQKMNDAATSLAKDTQVVSIGGDQWLVNKSTGAKIANLGPVTVSSTAMTLADKEALAAFTAGLKSPTDTVKTQVVSIDGHQWLVNTQTGAKIQDLGKVTTSNPLDGLFPDTPSTPTTPQYAASLYDQVGGGIDWASLGL